MNSVTNTSSLGEPSRGSTSQGSAGTQTLAQEQFFELMIAQLKNQDPTKPLDGSEYLSQLAEINTSTSIQNLNQSFIELTQSLHSMHALQASSLVGRTVVLSSGEKAVVQSVTIGVGGRGVTANLGDLGDRMIDEIETIL